MTFIQPGYENLMHVISPDLQAIKNSFIFLVTLPRIRFKSAGLCEFVYMRKLVSGLLQQSQAACVGGGGGGTAVCRARFGCN